MLKLSLSTGMACLAIVLFGIPLMVSASRTSFGLNMTGKIGHGACCMETFKKLPFMDFEGVQWDISDVNMQIQECETESLVKGNLISQVSRSYLFNHETYRDMINKNVIANLEKFNKTEPKYIPVACGKC